MSKRNLVLTIAVCFVGSMIISAPIAYHFARVSVNVYSNIGIDMKTTSVHARIRMYQFETPEARWSETGELVFDEYHAGVVTLLGDNQTMYKMFGDTDMQYADIPFMDNATFISIGDQGSLSESSTVLPGEWNRTAGTIEDETQSQINITCTFYPAAGPEAADCIGLNFNVTDDANNLWGYDTFTEVSGIDDTFTINVEFQVSTSHT